MSVSRQLLLAVGGLVIVIVALGGWVTYVTAGLSDITLQTELASRQGILAQRVTNFSLVYAQSRSDDDSQRLRGAIGLYQESIWGLVTGGSVPLDPLHTKMRFVPPVEDEEARLKGRRQLEVWRITRTAADRLLDAGGDAPEALKAIVSNDPQLVASANEMTSRLVAVAAAGVRQTTIMQIINVVVALIAGLFAVAVGRRVSRSIEHLTESADVMSRGELETPVPTHGVGEIAELGKSLDRMRISLKKAMEMIERKG